MKDGQILSIGPGDLVPNALQIKHDGYRLVQICATRTKTGYDLIYSFAKEYTLVHFRLDIPENMEIMSISNIFEPAFLYENEIVDLFGVKINLISIDYKGQLYRIQKKTPFK
ncbi:MAG: NADH-quinone oxidoreductase subunit C [Clostridiales bacterium]|jgi:ech hydrogenase subunit D|nr:NADH-quinone oxidoreductase subunit C [Clostridiales bacterium]